MRLGVENGEAVSEEKNNNNSAIARRQASVLPSWRRQNGIHMTHETQYVHCIVALMGEIISLLQLKLAENLRFLMYEVIILFEN